MAMETETPMASLYARLEQAGVKAKYVREVVLPSWWDDDAARTRAGFAQGALLIARHVGLDTASLLAPDRPILFDPCASPRFKKHVDADSDKMRFAVSVARQAACLAAQTVTAPYTPVPGSVAEMRRQVMTLFPGPVTLEKLVGWCWSRGIPVVHLSDLPSHRPQAMAVRVGGRPVIVLCENHKEEAWLAFLVAHELTHIAAGHLAEDDFRYDTAEDFRSDDGDEKTANQGACLLLTGSTDAVFVLSRPWRSAALSAEVRRFGKAYAIDPGAILLNIFHHQPKYRGLVMNILKEMHPNADAPAKVRAAMQAHLGWDELPNDDAQFLRKVSGL